MFLKDYLETPSSLSPPSDCVYISDIN